MEYSSPKMVIVLVVTLLVLSGIVQSSEDPSICQVPINGLMACKPAVTAPNPAPPTASCCTALVHADFNCFCTYKKNKMLPSLGIDPALAFQLPEKCKLSQTVAC